MRNGRADCQHYVVLGKDRYYSQMLALPGNFDWEEMLASVAGEVATLEEMRPK